MNISAPFIHRPVATTLLTVAVAIAGGIAFQQLPVSPLPQVDFPTISVNAGLPGASAEIMASSVATPLERQLGHIAGVTEMTSSSSLGTTSITIQFDLSRNIDGAARDVQAAINAARTDLPANLPGNPTYRKINPADSPIMILGLTSDKYGPAKLYDEASTVMVQKLSQIEGVGQVSAGGGALPSVRVEVNPAKLASYGMTMANIQSVLSLQNSNLARGQITDGNVSADIEVNGQISKAADYKPIIIGHKNGAAVHLSDVADVVDSVQNVRAGGFLNGKRAVLLIIFRQPGANIISTNDRILAALPSLEASIPSGIKTTIVHDRTTTIRASVDTVERTLLLSICLVIVVVFIFLRSGRATIIPAVAVPVSLIGTFAVMYLLGYSLDNLSLMALTIATGFVVDDAIVMLENISRHIEEGMPRFQAALQGAREVGFTVVSMSLSLVAVFLPIILMGGIVGRLFREFAITLSIAVLMSLVVSLTTTPMMCALVLTPDGAAKPPGRLSRRVGRGFDALLRGYDRTLSWALDHPRTIVLILFGTLCLNLYLYIIVPKGFFPQQDTGRLIGGLQADQSISFQLMKKKLTQFVTIVGKDKAVASVVGFTGGGQTNGGFVFVSLKPLSERKLSADQVIVRLRHALSSVPGAALFLQAVQDIRVGGRASNAEYQYTLEDDNLAELYEWTPKIVQALQHNQILTQVNSDQQENGLETDLVIDRSTAARLGLNASQIDNTLYDAFGQRLVSTIFNPLNQYHVVMEVAPKFWQSPETLKDIYVSAAGGAVGGVDSSSAPPGTVTSPTSSVTASAAAEDAARNLSTNALAASGKISPSTGAAVATASETMIPLAAFSHFGPGKTPLAINHQGQFAATTISFNLAPGHSLSDAVTIVNRAMSDIGVPATVHGSFQGTAAAFTQSLANEPYLILAALVAVYVVLGILYESYVHPITILSTLPSAGVGAVLALMAVNTEFSIIALIGVILLIGIVKKNAIMLIDFALAAERAQGLSPREAIYQAGLKRFRPIMMTTMAALLGALPLALNIGEGGELRQPLGISIVGGLIVSQMLTLYTTPVIYLYLDRFRLWCQQLRRPPGTLFARPAPGQR